MNLGNKINEYLKSKDNIKCLEQIEKEINIQLNGRIGHHKVRCLYIIRELLKEKLESHELKVLSNRSLETYLKYIKIKLRLNDYVEPKENNLSTSIKKQS